MYIHLHNVYIHGQNHGSLTVLREVLDLVFTEWRQTCCEPINPTLLRFILPELFMVSTHFPHLLSVLSYLSSLYFSETSKCQTQTAIFKRIYYAAGNLWYCQLNITQKSMCNSLAFYINLSHWSLFNITWYNLIVWLEFHHKVIGPGIKSFHEMAL